MFEYVHGAMRDVNHLRALRPSHYHLEVSIAASNLDHRRVRAPPEEPHHA